MFISELMGALLQLALFALLPFLVWVFSARKKEGFFQWIGIKKVSTTGNRRQTVLTSIIASVLYIALTIAVSSRYAEGVTTAGQGFAGRGFSAFPAVLIYSFIRTGLSEELLFRGFVLKRVSARFGFITGNTVQAVLFGLMHGIPFGIAAHNVLVTLLLTLLPGGFGWFLGWLNEKKSGGSILPSWILHGTMNAAAAVLSL